MVDLTSLPNKLDPKALTCRAVIETPKGRRSKYDYDPKARAFRLHSLLPDGMSFPLDFGFIPSTLCEDGDPMDVMVLSDEASEMGALLEVRLIGVMEAEESEKGDDSERNDRVLAVNCVSNLYQKVTTSTISSRPSSTTFPSSGSRSMPWRASASGSWACARPARPPS
ncbi:MAG TPA: inorganic diphosphatase [Caulobacteraceae bacterium]|nr:inorganic diphosphatase [Caulobacteraceae bacterium]